MGEISEGLSSLHFATEAQQNETRRSSLLYLFIRLFGLDRAKNTIVVYSELRGKPIETCWLRNSCIVYERSAEWWTFQHKFWRLCFAPLRFNELHNQSPLLTMCRIKEN